MSNAIETRKMNDEQAREASATMSTLTLLRSAMETDPARMDDAEGWRRRIGRPRREVARALVRLVADGVAARFDSASSGRVFGLA